MYMRQLISNASVNVSTSYISLNEHQICQKCEKLADNFKYFNLASVSLMKQMFFVPKYEAEICRSDGGSLPMVFLAF